MEEAILFVVYFRLMHLSMKEEVKCTSNVESFTRDHRYIGFISTEGEDSSVYTKVSSALEDSCGSSQSSTIESSDDEKSDEPQTKHHWQDNLRGE